MLENILTTQRSLDTRKHIALSVFIIIYLLMNLLVYPVFLFIYLFIYLAKERNKLTFFLKLCSLLNH